MDLTHHDEDVDDVKDLSATLEFSWYWVLIIHPELPKTEIWYRASGENTSVYKTRNITSSRITSIRIRYNGGCKIHGSSCQPLSKDKIIFKKSGRPEGHFLSQWTYLPQNDRRFMAKARVVSEIYDADKSDSDNND